MKEEKYSDYTIQVILKRILRDGEDLDIYDVDIGMRVARLAHDEAIKILTAKESLTEYAKQVVTYDKDIVNEFLTKYDLDEDHFDNTIDILNALIFITGYYDHKYEKEAGYNLAEYEYERIIQSLKPKSRKHQRKPLRDWLKIPENEKDLFIERLKSEFKDDDGLEVRYLVEALKNTGCMNNFPEKSGLDASLFDALVDCFNWEIGTYQGIFNTSKDSLLSSNIKNAEQKIKSILKSIK